MVQNRSSAVMQQRTEAHDSLDDFPTQPWGVRALIEYVIAPLYDGRGDLKGSSVWEPAANRGHMVRTLEEYFGSVIASDIHDYGAGFSVRDFLLGAPDVSAPWMITNPPFRLAEQFVLQSLRLPNWFGTAVLVRTSFLEGVGRYHSIFSVTPPSIVAQFTERLPMVKGRLTATGSTATSYCWLVWCRMLRAEPTKFIWIPPCRKRLEKPCDYILQPQSDGGLSHGERRLD